MKTIMHTPRIHASRNTVCRVLTPETGVTGWWTTEATLAPGEGGVIEVTSSGISTRTCYGRN